MDCSELKPKRNKKKERKKEKGLKKRQMKNQTHENRRVTMHEQPIKKKKHVAKIGPKKSCLINVI